MKPVRTKTNVIPECCEAEVDVRLVPGITKDDVVREFTDVVDRMKKRDPGFSAAIEVFPYAPSVELPESSPVLAIAKKATQRVFGYEPKLAAGHGTNDGV